MRDIFPDRINQIKPEQCDLQIGIHPDAYSFGIHNPLGEDTFLFHQLNKGRQKDAFSNFKEYFFENGFLGWPYRKIYLVNYSPNFTYVPSLMYEAKYKEELMDRLFSKRKTERVLDQRMEALGMILLHRIPIEVYDFFHRSFIDACFVHYSSGLISYFLNRKEEGETSRMVLFLRENELDIFCFRNGSLLLGNHYDFQNENDALYYVLFTWKQLDMDQMSDFVEILGTGSLKDELIVKIRVYIRNVLPTSLVSEPSGKEEVSTARPMTKLSTYPFPQEMLAISLCDI